MARVICAVDVSDAFFRGKGNLANEKNLVILSEIENLLERGIPEGWEAAFPTDNHRKGDPELQVFPEHGMTGTEEVKIVDELFKFVTPGNYVPKNSTDAFFRTDLEKILEQLEQKNPQEQKVAVVVGVCTEICILFAVAGFRNRGYEVIVPKDCVRALDTDKTGLWLNYLEKILGARVIDKQEEI